MEGKQKKGEQEREGMSGKDKETNLLFESVAHTIHRQTHTSSQALQDVRMKQQ